MAGRRVHLNRNKIDMMGRCLNACGCWSQIAKATDDEARVTCKPCLARIAGDKEEPMTSERPDR